MNSRSWWIDLPNGTIPLTSDDGVRFHRIPNGMWVGVVCYIPFEDLPTTDRILEEFLKCEPVENEHASLSVPVPNGVAGLPTYARFQADGGSARWGKHLLHGYVADKREVLSINIYFSGDEQMQDALAIWNSLEHRDQPPDISDSLSACNT